MYLLFTCMPGENNNSRRLRSLLSSCAVCPSSEVAPLVEFMYLVFTQHAR